jgi:hypothetical protein
VENVILGISMVFLILHFHVWFFVASEIGGVRQGWEQERTTCSGGWVGGVGPLLANSER